MHASVHVLPFRSSEIINARVTRREVHLPGMGMMYPVSSGRRCTCRELVVVGMHLPMVKANDRHTYPLPLVVLLPCRLCGSLPLCLPDAAVSLHLKED